MHVEGHSVSGQFMGKVALVTGAGSGIGRASAIAFAQEGAKVVVADVATEAGDETVRAILDAGGEGCFYATDVSRADQVAALIAHVVTTYGRLDFAHNNAGIEDAGTSFIDYTEEQWDQVVSIDLKGVWLCMKYEIIQMLKQGGGAIVNTSSVAGLIGAAGGPAYTASKHGVVGLTKTAALAYAKQGIRVNAVCPGVIETPMVTRFAKTPEITHMLTRLEPIGRFGQPAEVAAAVVWLCSNAASFVTGVALPVDGGWVAT